LLFPSVLENVAFTSDFDARRRNGCWTRATDETGARIQRWVSSDRRLTEVQKNSVGVSVPGDLAAMAAYWRLVTTRAAWRRALTLPRSSPRTSVYKRLCEGVCTFFAQFASHIHCATRFARLSLQFASHKRL